MLRGCGTGPPINRPATSISTEEAYAGLACLLAYIKASLFSGSRASGSNLCSSTSEDLADYRKEVSQALRRLGHEDVAMEYNVTEEPHLLREAVDDLTGEDLPTGWRPKSGDYRLPGAAG